MIFHEHRCIFFHIGKTAGTSIEQMIAPGMRDPYVANRADMHGYDEDLNIYLHHATCKTTRDIVDPEIFASYFKFAVVRNPFTRMISAYFYLYDQNQELYGEFADYVRRLPELAGHPEKLRGSHHIAQVHYTHIDGEQVVDFVGKFEDLDSTVAELNARLGLKTSLPRVNTARHSGYPSADKRALYDDETTAIIREVYKEDFETFGYPPDPPAR